MSSRNQPASQASTDFQEFRARSQAEGAKCCWGRGCWGWLVEGSDRGSGGLREETEERSGGLWEDTEERSGARSVMTISWRISRSTDEEVDGDAHSPEGERSVVTLAADLQEAAAALAVGRQVAEALQAQAAVAAAAAAAARETQSELEEAHTWAQAALEQGQQRERERQQQAQNAAGSKRRRSDTDDEDLSDPAAIQQEIARLQGILQEKRLETRLSARAKQPADGWESLVNRDLAFPELLDSAGSALKLWGQLVTTNLHLAVPANAEWVISGEHINAHCSIVDDFTALTDGDGGGLSLSLLPLTE